VFFFLRSKKDEKKGMFVWLCTNERNADTIKCTVLKFLLNIKKKNKCYIQFL